MITDGEGLENNFIPFHTIISIFGETVTYHTYGTLCYQFFGNILLYLLVFHFAIILKEAKSFSRYYAALFL